MTVVETQDVVFRKATCSANGARESTSLLGPVGRSMRLKISRDEPQSSDIVELASRRCLVGSAPSCDVRVDEPGVAPIECLIFHGSKNNVVRWLDTSQEFAGGELFEDEVLRAGDPLQIGPVELEFLIDEIMAAEVPSKTEEMSRTSEDRLAEYILRIERLEVQLIELQQASEVTASLSGAIVQNDSDSKQQFAATISDLANQLALLQSRSAAERDLWSGEKTELETLLQSRLREFDFLQDEVQRLRDELATVRSKYGNLSANHDASQRLAEVSQELAERTEDFEQAQTNWQRDRSEFQRQLQQNIERLEQFETQLAEQSERQAESEAARQAAETRADRLQESVEELSKRLARQQEEYESVRAAWEVDRASLESELAETTQRFAQSAAAESTGLELQEAWNRERTVLQSQVDEANRRAEEVQEELEAQRRRQHQGPCDSQPDNCAFDLPSEAAEQRLDREISVASCNPMDRLLAGSSLVNDLGNEVDDLVRDFTSPTPMIRGDAESEYPNVTCTSGEYGLSAHEASDHDVLEFSDLQSAADFNDAMADEGTFENSLLEAAETNDYGHVFEAKEPASDEGEEVAFESASSAPPVSTLEVLARLGESGVWSDDETDADDSSEARIADASNSPNDVFSRFAEPETATTEPQCEQPPFAAVGETPFTSAMTNATSDSDEEEESIEAYMGRLMNRVRATDGQNDPSLRVRPTLERSPVTEYTEVPKAPQPNREPEPVKFNPDEYKPRSQAPELADRMTAMRSLANDSARTAIASHAKRNWSSVMQLKLLVSVFAFVSVLASIIFFWGDPLLMVVGSLAGVGVLAYWTRNAITYRKLLQDSLMLEPEVGDYDDLSPYDSPQDEDAA